MYPFGVRTLYRHFVQLSAIDAEAKAAIFFPHEHHRSHPFDLGGFDNVNGERAFDFRFLEFSRLRTGLV